VVLADGLGKEQGHSTTRRVRDHDSGLFVGKRFHQASPSEHRYLEQNVKSEPIIQSIRLSFIRYYTATASVC
jgi:hypothetical protein